MRERERERDEREMRDVVDKKREMTEVVDRDMREGVEEGGGG